MTLPADIEFHEDIRLFIYRPSGLLDQASVSRAVNVLADHEAKLKEPFNRFSDTSAIDELPICDSGLSVPSFDVRRSPAGEIGDSNDGLYHRPLFSIACHNH